MRAQGSSQDRSAKYRAKQHVAQKSQSRPASANRSRPAAQESKSNHVSVPVERAYGNYETTGFDPESLRKGFVRKVLFILIICLAITTFAIGTTFIDSWKVREFVVDHKALIWVAIAGALVSAIVLMCKRDACVKVPLNYIMLLVYTCSMSYIVMAVAAVTESEVVIFAGGMTIAIVFGVSLYACTTKTDLTKKGYIISGLCCTLLMLLILGLAFRSRFLSVLYSALIGALFTFLLAYNIQRLIGKYENQYTLDEYIIAALDLYIDIVRIFLVILTIRRSND